MKLSNKTPFAAQDIYPTEGLEAKKRALMMSIPNQSDSEDKTALPGFFELPFGMAPKNRSVVLTFDDGPDAAGLTDRILDILQEKQATGTFFVTSRNREANGTHPELCRAQATLRRMRAEGHEVGNHTASHPELKDLDVVAIQEELDALDGFVGEAWDEPNLKLSLMRAPYGRPMYPHDRVDTPQNFVKVSECLAYRSVHVGWTLDTNDWQDKSSQQLIDDALDLLDGSQNGGILLMHSIWPRTCDALPAIIDGIRARGFTLATCEDYIKERYGAESRTLLAAAAPQKALAA